MCFWIPSEVSLSAPLLQDKCRLPVRQGVSLLGVLDETGALPEGMFWASWDPTPGSRGLSTARAASLPRGTRALVSRAPCMSPCDVRVLTAADAAALPDALTSLHNVIVFSRSGSTPEPAKMSGGDLDGDIFFVIWDPALVPAREAAALDYAPPARPRALPGGVSVSAAHVVQHLLDFLRADCVGSIANAHLALADSAPEGPHCAQARPARMLHMHSRPARHAATYDAHACVQCRQLITLHSIAVDFAKTGVPVNREALDSVLVGVRFPDFLGGRTRSSSVVGRIFRDARWRRARATAPVPACGGDARFTLPGAEAHIPWAQRVLNEWTAEVSELMCACVSVSTARMPAMRAR
jgi:hypothetical protein